jgi:hypothetical protein
VESAKFESLKKQEEKNGFKENGAGECFFRKGTADSWKDELTPKQVERIERNHAGSMGRWGYELTRHRKTTPNTFPRLKMSASGTVS